MKKIGGETSGFEMHAALRGNLRVLISMKKTRGIGFEQKLGVDTGS